MNSRVLAETCWFPSKADARDGVRLDSVLAQGPELFSVYVQTKDDGNPPINAIFGLDADAAIVRGAKTSLSFTWTYRYGFPLPSMHGEIVARRFGPVVSLAVRAHYSYDDGPAGRLFHEAVGGRLARETFAKLMVALRLLIERSNTRKAVAAKS
jgi:hypothetical protein